MRKKQNKTLYLYVCSHLRTRIHTYAERVTPCAASACHTQKPVQVSDLLEASLKVGRHQQAAWQQFVTMIIRLIPTERNQNTEKENPPPIRITFNSYTLLPHNTALHTTTITTLHATCLPSATPNSCRGKHMACTHTRSQDGHGATHTGYTLTLCCSPRPLAPSSAKGLEGRIQTIHTVGYEAAMLQVCHPALTISPPFSQLRAPRLRISPGSPNCQFPLNKEESSPNYLLLVLQMQCLTHHSQLLQD